MWTSWKEYNWVNPSTGDEFLYFFVDHPNKQNKKLLILEEITSPISKHPLGFILFSIAFLFFVFSGGNSGLFLAMPLISGSFISFLFYLYYYFKVHMWKKQVIKDFKNGRLRYKSPHCYLGKKKKKDPSNFNSKEFFILRPLDWLLYFSVLGIFFWILGSILSLFIG